MRRHHQGRRAQGARLGAHHVADRVRVHLGLDDVNDGVRAQGGQAGQEAGGDEGFRVLDQLFIGDGVLRGERGRVWTGRERT